MMPNQRSFLTSMKHCASAVLAAAVFALATPASAQTSGVMGADQLSSLVAQANENGRVRVIVELAIPGAEAGLSAAQVEAQRAAIAQGQAAMAGAFGEDAVNRTYATVPMIALSLTATQVEQLQSMSGVSAVHLDELSEPSLNRSTRITRARRLWRAGVTGEGSAVAVLDTGIAYNNRAFRPHADVIPISACYSSNEVAYNTTSACWNMRTSHIAPYAAPAPDLSVSGAGHGTHVAATVAANRPRGLQGMAPDAMIIPIQVFSIFPSNGGFCNGISDCMLSWSTDQLAALDQIYQWVQAGTYPIVAVNMSLGGGRYTDYCNTNLLAGVIQNLRSAGVAVVIASGNNGYTNAVGAPACIEDAVTVGASDDFDNIASFSNQAPMVDLMAPGVSIEAAYPDTRTSTASLQGTSMAAPHVAGAFALLRQQFPNHTVDQLETALNCTGESVTRANTTGTFYRIHLQRARSYLVGYGNHPRCP